MEIWHKSKMSTLFYSRVEASENYDCVVKIENQKILVEYADEAGKVIQYVGDEMGEGHYVLKCPALAGKATLHRLKNSLMFEGNWVESSYRGMWQIWLA
jgi:hypothetical protein